MYVVLPLLFTKPDLFRLHFSQVYLPWRSDLSQVISSWSEAGITPWTEKSNWSKLPWMVRTLKSVSKTCHLTLTLPTGDQRQVTYLLWGTIVFACEIKWSPWGSEGAPLSKFRCRVRGTGGYCSFHRTHPHPPNIGTNLLTSALISLPPLAGPGSLFWHFTPAGIPILY